MENSKENFIRQLLARADITIGGSNPWDIDVHNKQLYQRVLTSGSLGLGESYMDGWWDVPALDEFFFRLLQANLGKYVRFNLPAVWAFLSAQLINLQKGRRTYHIGKAHYDIGNDLYQAMLDRRLTYTCGYWQNATTLDEAQEQKLDLVCRKIGLKTGQRVLDIGCGWGRFAQFSP